MQCPAGVLNGCADESGAGVIRAQPGHELLMANFYAVNEEHLRPWTPKVPLEHHSLTAWKQRLLDREEDFNKGFSAHFIGVDVTESFVIGSCSLSNVIQGGFKSCFMGYSVAHRYEGQGYMQRIVKHAIEYAFNELQLHRIMANHMPVNERSAGLLKKLGFEKEGYARNYLYINGRWEDHVLTALLNPQQE